MPNTIGLAVHVWRRGAQLHDQQAIEEGVRQPVPCETTLHTLNAEWNTNVGHGLRVVFRQKLESRAKRGEDFQEATRSVTNEPEYLIN